MKTLRLYILAPFALLLVLALYFYEGARESWKKYRLGSAYEGPLED